MSQSKDDSLGFFVMLGFFIFAMFALIAVVDESRAKRERQTTLEAIKAGLHQDKDGHWVKHEMGN